MQSLSIIRDQQSSKTLAVKVRSRGSVLPDWLGVVASVGCAIHCASMPFVITFLPALGLSFLADQYFHQVMVGVCALLALLAFVPGWRVHRKWLPAGIAVMGLTFIGAAAFALDDSCACCTPPENSQSAAAEQAEASICTDEHCEHCSSSPAKPEVAAKSTASPMLAGFTPWITPLGGVLLVLAHLANRRLSCQCGCCPPKTASV